MSDVLRHTGINGPAADEEPHRCDRDAFYFLAAILIILVTIAIFNAEIMGFISAALF